MYLYVLVCDLNARLYLKNTTEWLFLILDYGECPLDPVML